MALACQYQYMKVQIGTMDFTRYLSNTEQTATMPAGAEVGRATLTFRDDGSMPAIPKWGTVVISSGTAAPGTPVWGGYATRQSSEPFSMSGGTVRMVTVDCQSYAIALTTTAPITETFGGGDYDSIVLDTAIVSNLVQTYLPAFYDAGSISSASPVQCDYIQFSEETLRSALNKIDERSAKDYGITAAAKFYYRPRSSAGYSEHKLSDVPDYSATWPMQAKPYSDIDDVEVRNAVRVVGGWTLSAVQDETFTTDGIAYSFVVNYFPQDVIRVRLANVVLSVGVYLVDPPADFDVLVHYDQRKFIFQLPPGGGKTLEIEYRYPVRVEETVTNAASIAQVGGTLWGPTIQDSSISQATVAQLIGSAYLDRVTQSNERGQLTTNWVGTVSPYLPGQIIQVYTQALGWDEEPLEIQGVTMRFAPRPGGNGVCLTYWDLDVGRIQSFGHTLGGVYQDAPEVRAKTSSPAIRAAITAGDVPTLDHGTALSGLGDDDHTQYLLATGARTGASSQAQTFTNGIIGPTWKPISDSTTAIQIQKAGGTPVVTIDTTNGMIGIGCTPTAPFDLVGSARTNPFAYYLNKNDDANWAPIRYGWALANGSNEFGINIGAYNAGGNAILRWQMYGSPTQWQFDPGSDDIFSVEKRFLAKAGLIGQYHTDLDLVLNQHTNGGADKGIKFKVAGGSTTAAAIMETGLFGVGTDAPTSLVHASLNNATTNAVDNILTIAHNSTGTPASGFGSGLAFNLESSTTLDQNAAAIAVSWFDATHASRKGQLALSAYDASAARRGLTIGSDGAAATLGLYSAGPVAQATTSGAAASFTANSGTAVNDKSTFDGYTISQVVKALRNLGALA